MRGVTGPDLDADPTESATTDTDRARILDEAVMPPEASLSESVNAVDDEEKPVSLRGGAGFGPGVPRGNGLSAFHGLSN
jgi:hypothetical protein